MPRPGCSVSALGVGSSAVRRQARPMVRER